MKNTNKLTVPDLISIGVFAALYFVLVAVATFSSVLIFPGFNNVVLPAFCALISGSVLYAHGCKSAENFGAISVMGIVMGAVFSCLRLFHRFFCRQYCHGDSGRLCGKAGQL